MPMFCASIRNKCDNKITIIKPEARASGFVFFIMFAILEKS